MLQTLRRAAPTPARGPRSWSAGEVVVEDRLAPRHPRADARRILRLAHEGDVETGRVVRQERRRLLPRRRQVARLALTKVRDRDAGTRARRVIIEFGRSLDARTRHSLNDGDERRDQTAAAAAGDRRERNSIARTTRATCDGRHGLARHRSAPTSRARTGSSPNAYALSAT